MFSATHTSTRRGPALLAATLTLVVAMLAGPTSALADTVSISSSESFPTVGDRIDMTFTVTAYGASTAEIYAKAGPTSCPATAGEADDGGMSRLSTRTVAGDGVAHPMGAYSWPSSEGRYLYCAYTYRDADPAAMRGTASFTLDVEEEADAPLMTVATSQGLSTSNSVAADVSCVRACTLSVTGTAGSSGAMDVALGTATATIGAFGGSTTVRVPMSSSQRRDLRARITAGESVRADLLATATFGSGASFDTSATTALRLLSWSGVSVPARTFTGV